MCDECVFVVLLTYVQVFRERKRGGWVRLSVLLFGSRRVGVKVGNRKRVGVEGTDGIYKQDEGDGQKNGVTDGSCGEGKKRKKEKRVEREFKRSGEK